MADSTKFISRRDWFRIRPDNRKPLLGSQTGKPDEPSLSPIAHPPNHDGMDLSQLPPLREARLSEAQIELLFSDLETHAKDIQLFQRSKLNSRGVPNPTPSLASAKDAILSAKVNKLQIRYRWSDSLWIDTIETLDNGFRLIRVAHAGR